MFQASGNVCYHSSNSVSISHRLSLQNWFFIVSSIINARTGRLSFLFMAVLHRFSLYLGSCFMCFNIMSVIVTIYNWMFNFLLGYTLHGCCSLLLLTFGYVICYTSTLNYFSILRIIEYSRFFWTIYYIIYKYTA